MTFLLRVVISAVAFWVASMALGEHLEVLGGDTTGGRVVVFLAVALVFGLVNAVVKPVVQFFAFPLYIVTLGLFTLVVNALMILLTEWITGQTDWGLRVDGFWWAVVAALIVSVVNLVLSGLLPDKDDRR
ncbi:phage holin family protein [Sanguibacter suaedae]|uniref:Phage holin family protein n=1 Tax=Sanguibacter suaedae TaxID=2795737 RepID=A0A934IDF2_9MICO|nr:phage holin family protein [Sanguibacter suaedae]MBI9115710.1 phage holin family protein [Sanguibacter suaedae]